jgi:hypothetical protein
MNEFLPQSCTEVYAQSTQCLLRETLCDNSCYSVILKKAGGNKCY